MRSEPLTEDQKALVAEHVEFATMLATRRRNPWTSLEDRTQEAFIGLIDAAKSFDPAQGVKFETYAYRRIMGAIIDAEREAGTGAAVKISRWARGNGEAEIGVVSIEAMNQLNYRDLPSDVFFVDDSPPVAEAVDRRDAIEKALLGLPGVDRAAARLYWLEGRTMKQTGAALDLSESRISQMMTRCLSWLRECRVLADYAEVA